MSSHNRTRMHVLGHRLASLFGFIAQPWKRSHRDHHTISGKSLSKPLPPSDEDRDVHLEEQSHTHPSIASPTPLPVARVKLTIHVLPDDVLLEIFDHCRGDNDYFAPKLWKPLVHVCRQWRYIVFASPQRLRLLLVCDVKTPVRELLDIWPLLPITIHYSPEKEGGERNVIAALEHHCRISWIVLKALTSQELESFTAVMQEPLPALMGLHLRLFGETRTVISNTFLGGSTPRLQSIFLEGIAFPALPRFVVPATHLTKLCLRKIPNAGYIGPEAMASCLSVLRELEELHIGFRSPQSRPHRTTRPPLVPVILPALTYLGFRGVREYLEDLVSRITTPKLCDLDIQFFMGLIFEIPQLNEFIRRENSLKLCKRAYIDLYPWSARIIIESPTFLHLRFKCDRLDWRVSSMAQLCNELSTFLSEVERLQINGDSDLQLESHVDMESMQWLELFRPFPAVRALYISKKLGPPITYALEELSREKVTVLPALRVLSLGGLKPYGAIHGVKEPFITESQLSGHPINVKCWEQDPHRDPEDDDYAVSDGMDIEDSQQVTQEKQGKLEGGSREVPAREV